MGIFLGLDSSTQSLSALAVDTESGEVVLEESLNFGSALPEYHSPSGFLLDPDPRLKHADPLLWVAAIDRLLEKVKASGFDLGRVRGVSGAGQQHGSVYLKTRISDAPRWSSARPLVEQIRPLLSRASAPIWMDSSTSTECAEIAAALGGDANVVTLTGSRAIERFTGPQIRKFWKTEPDSYAKTQEVALVSSFIASILIGASAPIDHGDGAGMNLLDLRAGAWSPALLEATAPELARRLRAPVPSGTRIGELAPYFVEKYGFASQTPVIAFTGDNPSSLVGMGATEPGTAVVSLGTSDTVFAAMREPRTDPNGYGHVFGNPAGGFMCLICFANGSLAREEVRKRVALSWPEFERAILEQTKPGNAGNFMLPYFVPEMTPKVLEPRVELEGSPEFCSFKDAAACARAVVETQVLSMQRHSDWIGERPRVVRVTGGAAKNRGILQVLADVFEAEICTLSVANSSALGGALRAAQAVEGLPWSELYARFVSPDAGSRIRSSAEASGAYGVLRATLARKLSGL
ncbi:MAG TPA: FGGY family carbohydrate kinase [Polyangiaceae bacterium]|jgi:xylulokinase|nr:FGGY family carbohydrate kinase [Polyangiaceae bacterium]